jgi:tetratricopeptide (TPR) repeat protein
LWQQLAGEPKPFAPALLNLARQHENLLDATKHKLAIEFYTRYGELEPDDPRTHVALAQLYDYNDDDTRAESEHRAALKSDPSNTEESVALATFLALRKRFAEATAIIDVADKIAGAEDDLFGNLMSELYFADEKIVIEELARSQPQRMAKSPHANLYLGFARLDDGKNLLALTLLKRAATLKKDWSVPYVAMARGYRSLRNWPAALSAADTAIRIEADYSDGYFHRACALARLGRIEEALRSLEKAVELDSDWFDSIGEEADLKVLAAKPAFKKLLAGQQPKP